MKKLLAILATASLILLNSCSKTDDATPQAKISRHINAKLTKEEIIDLNQNRFYPEFSKYANSEAKNSVTIIAQSSGIITSLPISSGDKVKTKQTIAKIGNSLASDINQSQINASENSLELLQESKENVLKGTKLSLETTEISVKTAQESYQNATLQKKNTEDLFEIQYDSANTSYKTAKNAYNDASDALEDFKLNNFDPEKIAEKEAQVKALKTAYKQSKYALEQVEENQEAQKDQLDYAIEVAKNQYELAKKQYDSIALSNSSQLLGIEGQELQLNGSKELLEINKKYNTITSPINGIVERIHVSENSFVGSGQSIATIEDPSEIILKTSLNENEIKLIKLYDLVEVFNEDEVFSGKINSINHTPDPSTKKYEIEISLPKNTNIVSGKLIKIKFKYTENEKIFIPINSIAIHNGKKSVKILDDKNFINELEIETGEIFGNLIEVKNGLFGNEKILAQGQSFLENGTKIVIAE
ncbi:MAG: efflux RND transporter periplasmic adaptor subunit [Candidatus Gracilibacteria bacterium]|jgi:RND family efflux transporter MFP subunit|nr:efflux RND transporter periplasmic adaptor subunit [Candidatus Gracilibacteria bacterium]